LHNSAPVLAGPIHGDLHATNVLVRGSDAIVIDFEKSEDGKPLLYDAASLEAGFLVDGFRTDERSNTDLIASIERLYQGGVVLNWTAPHHPNDPSAWFYDCVRQIRIHGNYLECKPGQYGTALALALVKKACNPDVFDDQRERLRAIAYLLSERILTASVN
jgi:Ternary complex associated domain 9